MIDVKTAVRTALDYLDSLREFAPVRGARLEETEFDDSGFWLITLSTLEDPPKGSLLEGLGIPNPGLRSYRAFRIDAKTGEVKSMKVRTLQPVE